ncbi:HNH endonuclease [Algoriphagus terrigena]|uniref:HNH endonuclease n=1 Tax=Algoriphagus terrigena TaxID=344884 RepID=UPI0004101D5D|nr:HNH endonuclease [Algoriphagus terrigena]
MTIRSHIFSFISLKESYVLKWNGDFDLLGEFLTIFKYEYLHESRSIRIDPVQINSRELFENFIEFVNANADRIPKEINFFQRFLKSLPKNHFFFVVFGTIDSTERLMQYFDSLREIHDKNGIPVNKVAHSKDALALLKKYDLSFYGHQRRLVGYEGSHKMDRVCRFCGGQNGQFDATGGLVSFRNKAHVIPESLGNKKLVSIDECDNCNSKFGRGIEQSLLEYFSVFRALNEIKGKGGKKKLVGKDFVFHPEKGFEIKYPGNIDENTQSLNLKLKTNSSFIPQDVYRSLVKMIINVLDNPELASVQRTIDWVNGNFSAGLLPNIMIAQSHDFYVNDPMLVTYRRRINEHAFPHVVGEFRFTDISLCFVVPFSDNDRRTFIRNSDFKKFWNDFEECRSKTSWMETSFSSKSPRRTVINFKLEGLKFGENFFHMKSKDVNP